MSALLTKTALKKVAQKVGEPLKKEVKGAPVWLWATGISVTALSAWLLVRSVRKKMATTEESKGFGADKHATWANQLMLAMDGPGTTESSIRKVLREIPSLEDWDKVQKSYQKIKKGKQTLVDRLKEDLNDAEYSEMLAIMRSKPEKAKDAGAVIYDPHGWATRFNSAINYALWGFLWGTDTGAIEAVIADIPTRQAFADTAQAYREIYGVSMMEDLEGDLSYWQIAKYKEMVMRKPFQ